MNAQRRCAACGVVLSADATEDVCSKCLLEVGMHGSSSGDSPGSEDPTLPPSESSSADEATLPPHGSSTSDSPSPGTKVHYFGDYELLEEIARGGMGVVYKARQLSLNRIVALKMILAGQLAGEAEIQRFHTEAEAAAKLDHPGIVPIYEVGEHEGQHYFSMGFVEGQSLADKLNDGPLPAKEAANLIECLANAVAYAHEKGVIHRDLKPANVLLDKNSQARVTDFGLAKKMEADSNLTGTGQILGTPSYMPPEQAAGKTNEIGPTADVYALGAVLYTMLTGRPPFQAATPMDTLLQVLDKEPVSPRKLTPRVSRDLETICLKCLEKDPRRRYTSAGELSAEVARHLKGEPIKARPLSVPGRAWRWVRRNPLAATLTLTAAVALVLGVAVSSFFALSERRSRVTTAMRLADQSDNIREQQPIRSLLLASEAVETTHRLGEPVLPVAHNALIAALQIVGGQPFRLDRFVTNPMIGAFPASIGYTFGPGRWLVCGEALIDLHAKDPFLHPLPLGKMPREFSPDGRWLVATDSAHGATLWDLNDDPAIRIELQGWVSEEERDQFRASAGTGPMPYHLFSPNGHWLLRGGGVWMPQSRTSGDLDSTSSPYNKVRLWALPPRDSAKPDVVLRGHTSPVKFATFSADSRWLVTGTADNSMRLWDLAGAEPDRNVQVFADDAGGEINNTRRIQNAVFLDPGRKLLTISPSEMRLWDLQQHPPTSVLLKSWRVPMKVAVSPDGSWLAAGYLVRMNIRGLGGIERRMRTDATTVWLYDLTSESFADSRVALAESGAAVLEFSANSRWLVTGRDKTARVWDLSSARLELTDNVQGRTGSGGSSDSKTGTPELTSAHVLRGHEWPLSQAAISADGRWVVTSAHPSLEVGRQQSRARLWDLSGGSHSSFPMVVPARSVSPDGSWLLRTRRIDDRTWTAILWDANAKHPISTKTELGEYTGELASAGISADSRWLMGTTTDGKVRVWNLKSADIKQSVLELTGPHNPNGRVTVVSTWSGDGRWLALGSGHDIRLWNLTASDPAKATVDIKIDLAEQSADQVWLRELQFSPDRSWLAATAFRNRDSIQERNTLKQMWLWRLEKFGPPTANLRLRQPDAGIRNLATTSDSRWLITGGEDGAAHLWDLRLDDPSSKSVHLQPASRTSGGGNRDGFSISADGAWLAWPRGRDANTQIWNLLSDDVASSHFVLPEDKPEKEEDVKSAIFSPNSRWLSTVVSRSQDSDAALCLWDINTKAHSTVRLTGQDSFNLSTKFSRDDRWIATFNYGGESVRLWDISFDPASVPLVLEHEHGVSDVVFFPEGRRIFTQEMDQICIWDLRIDRLLELARERAGRELTADERSEFSIEGKQPVKRKTGESDWVNLQQGTWHKQALTVGGEDLLAGEAADAWSFRGENNTWSFQEVTPLGKTSPQLVIEPPLPYVSWNSREIVHFGSGAFDASAVTIDPAREPKHIEIGGVKGIYRLDGDMLTICYSYGESRPTELRSNRGEETVLLVLKRVGR